MAQLLTGRKRIASVSGVALAVVVGGAAFAYWTQSGSGTGDATTGNIDPITIVQTSTNSTNLMWPGGPSVALSGTYTNPNDAKVYVHQVYVKINTGWEAQADTSKPKCTAADFTLTGNVGSLATGVAGISVDAEILANDTSTWSGLSIQLDDHATNQDNCKDVTPGLTYWSD